jgi:GrpB-like predicted nucleotidyltransferase (UPF0157 family)
MTSTIQIDAYNPSWPQWFAQLRDQIWPAVQDAALTIEHVGSTSVPGLAAKPIIDIDIIIEHIDHLAPVIRGLKRLGYEHRGNLGIEGREAFKAPEHPIRHHLYVCLKDCTALKNHLNLKHHLHKHPESRLAYEALKRSLSHASPEEYLEGKTPFILRILAQYDMGAAELGAIAAANLAPYRRTP